MSPRQSVDTGTMEDGVADGVVLHPPFVTRLNVRLMRPPLASNVDVPG
jgi:hypothetical protein